MLRGGFIILEHNCVFCSTSTILLPTQLLPPFPSPFACIPSDYTIHVEGNSPSPSSFSGSSAGTTVIIGEGEYSVTETKPTPTPGREIIEHLSPDCSGSISLGESKTCIITNEVRPAPPLPGPTGPDKELQVRTDIGVDVIVEPNSRGTAVAQCAPDEKATGGGTNEIYSNTSNPEPQQVSDIGLPVDDPTRWEIEYSNPGPDYVVIQAFAQCAKLVDAP